MKGASGADRQVFIDRTDGGFFSGKCDARSGVRTAIAMGLAFKIDSHQDGRV